jgi:hypothetical protein
VREVGLNRHIEMDIATSLSNLAAPTTWANLSDWLSLQRLQPTLPWMLESTAEPVGCILQLWASWSCNLPRPRCRAEPVGCILQLWASWSCNLPRPGCRAEPVGSVARSSKKALYKVHDNELQLTYPSTEGILDRGIPLLLYRLLHIKRSVLSVISLMA